MLAESRRHLEGSPAPEPDGAGGSFSDVLRRTNPYGYSILNLDVMTARAATLSTKDEDLMCYTLPDGRYLVKGVEWLVLLIADKDAWLISAYRTLPGKFNPVAAINW